MSKKFLKSRLGLSSIVVTVLFLVVAISSVVMFQNWFKSFESEYFAKIDNQNMLRQIESEELYGDKLYVKNSNSVDIILHKLIIDKRVCINSSYNLSAKDVSIINLGTCLVGEDLGPKNVVLITNSGVFSKTLLLRSQVFGNFSVIFKNSGTCDLGYIRVYGLEQVSNSHAEIGSSSNYTYSFCIKHNDYTLGTNCSASNSVRLFYLDGASDAHGYETNSSPYESDWHSVCISSDGGILSSQISNTDPGDGSVCVGSFDDGGDDIIGHHMGDCSAYNKRVWLKID